MKNEDSSIFSHSADFFREYHLPEQNAKLTGYSALINAYQLESPLPDCLFAIGQKHKKYQKDNWIILGPRYQPEDSLYAHLIFALKYEGINLSVLSALFQSVGKEAFETILQTDPNGSYSRRIWFLYEWVTGKQLDCPDMQDKKIRFVEVLDPKLQYAGPTRRSLRHRINNNLPGVPNFCPLCRKTELLENFIQSQLNVLANSQLKQVPSDLLMRAAAFLLLEDSKASYAIEGETPPHNRAQRWGTAIGQAGKYPLSHEELLRLQQIVISDFRYTHPGYRFEGGFIGQHERGTFHPIPHHISARPEDLNDLMEGLIETYNLLKSSDHNAVLAATIIAFGLVFIHPFEDGNGRIHRYLIHHMLAEKGFTPEGVIFPVSYVMLERLKPYRLALEAYSAPRLPFIKWRPTEKGNVEVLNETIDLYRYFDATKQAEFLFSCIQETIEKTLPNELDYLKKHDEIKRFIENHIEMPDSAVDLLIKFLQQENGRLSKRAKEKEFKHLTEKEINTIESKFKSIFYDDVTS